MINMNGKSESGGRYGGKEEEFPISEKPYDEAEKTYSLEDFLVKTEHDWRIEDIDKILEHVDSCGFAELKDLENQIIFLWNREVYLEKESKKDSYSFGADKQDKEVSFKGKKIPREYIVEGINDGSIPFAMAISNYLNAASSSKEIVQGFRDKYEKNVFVELTEIGNIVSRPIIHNNKNTNV